MADEVKDVVKEGGETEEVVTPAAEEVVAEVAVEETEKEPKPQEKKFTDADMKAARESFEHEAEKERKRLELEVENRILKEIAEGKKGPKPEEKPVDAPVKPTRPIEGDFNTNAEYQAAMDKYEDDRDAYRDYVKSKDQSSKSEAEKVEASRKAFEESVVKQVVEGRKAYKDFDKVVVNNKDLVATPIMAAAMAKRENGHHVQYFLGQNPDESLRIARLDPIDVAVEIGIISERLKSKATQTPVKKPTGAPVPAATVSGKAKVSTDTTLEGKSQEERLRIIEAAARNRRMKQHGS